VFSCDVAVRETDMALLVTPNGFHIYLHAVSRRGRAADAAGVQYLLWATDTESDLPEFAQRLRAYDPAVFSHTENGVSVVEGLDPDGGRVLIDYPSPFQLARAVKAARLHA
jgi:hypothetical protein